MSPAPATSRRLPASIWALGLVSLLMDVSSELIHSLLPVFMVTVLGASMLTVGLIEGAAESTALIVKVFAGALSDWWGRRKPLAIMGYGLGALSKPLFALATTMGMVVAARLIDRVGKGIRGAPRDALVADIAPPDMRGAAFGLRQSLDTVGAFLGPVLAMLLMLLWANDFRAVFWVAVVPAALCVA
ncbi:MAG TPA: MFS transporter, partial [Comamonadaceae bacterium]|nr:MFS transporter [Comamonadaceae bacterium]